VGKELNPSDGNALVPLQGLTRENAADYVLSGMRIKPVRVLVQENHNVISVSVSIEENGVLWVKWFFLAKWEGIINEWDWIRIG
jgi:hypothetical protein